MIKFYVTLLSLLFVPRTQTLSVSQTNKVLDVSVLIRAKQYAVDPKTRDVKRGMAGCSGTYVSPTKILTAAHCFSDPTTNIWVRGRDGSSSPAILVKYNDDQDLALLEVKPKKKQRYAKVTTNVRVGEQVINVGSPYFFEFLLSEGIVAAEKVWIKKYKARYLITTAMINPGSSGGGAFNSKGELIGVNTMSIGLFGWSGISIAVDSYGVTEFLKGAI